MNQMKIDRIIYLKKKIASLKKYYNELDAIVENTKPGIYGRIVIIDNFADKNVTYKTTSMRRYEALVMKEQKK